MIAEVVGPGTQYIHTDALGSPRARINTSNGIISRTRYEPYGRTAMGAEPTIGFTGHWNDLETGLTYMQQRYYDPVAGRMLSIDPVVTDADTGSSFNRYIYAKNSPYKYLDPDGREAREKFVEEIRKNMEASNGEFYKPHMPVAVAVTAGMAVVPAAIAVASSGITVVAAAGGAGKIASVALSQNRLRQKPK
ncbi:MAG: RHS repeat domain-containing protein [Telluria sp.]